MGENFKSDVSTEGHAMEGNAVEAKRDTLPMWDTPSTSKAVDVGVVPSLAKELGFWENTENGVNFSKTVQAKLEGCKDIVKCNVRRASDRKINHTRAHKIKRGQKILNAAMKTINSLPNVEEEQKKSPDVETPKKTSNTLERKASSDGAESTQSAAPQKANKRALPVRRSKTEFRFIRKNSRSKNTKVARSQSYSSSASDSSSQDQRKRSVAKSRRRGPPAKRQKLGKVVEARSESTSGRSSDSGCSDCGFFGYGD